MKMKVITIKNDIIPFDGYMAITIWPFIFVKRKAWGRFNEKEKRHELIHCHQQIETHVVSLMLLVLLASFGLFSWWWVLTFPLVYFAFYGLEYLVRLVIYGFNGREAYRNISFEQEAYLNESDMTYLINRKLFASWRYLFRKTYHYRQTKY